MAVVATSQQVEGNWVVAAGPQATTAAAGGWIHDRLPFYSLLPSLRMGKVVRSPWRRAIE